MRVLTAVAVLSAGIWFAIANVAPSRFITEMIPVGAESRVASFANVGETAEPAPFETTMKVAANQTASKTESSTSRVAEPDSWAQGTTSTSTSIDMETRTSLARDIQSELARLGCYAGPVNGDWSAETQRAASMFATEANARIPVDQPDFALFSLAKTAGGEQSCGPPVTVAAQTPLAPAMGLGGPNAQKQPKTASYRRDRDVESLFTNPLGR